MENIFGRQSTFTTLNRDFRHSIRISDTQSIFSTLGCSKIFEKNQVKNFCRSTKIFDSQLIFSTNNRRFRHKKMKFFRPQSTLSTFLMIDRHV